MRLAFFVSCVLSVSVVASAEPDTKPANENPITRLEKAKGSLRQAEDLCLRRLEDTQAYKSAIADLSAKEKTLADARRSTNPSDRLSASAAFLRARNAVQTMKANARQSDPAITVAAAELSTAQHEADAFLRVAQSEAKRQTYLSQHPVFAKLREKLDAVKSARDPSNSDDAYLSYVGRTNGVITAIQVLTDYFQLNKSDDWDVNEYHELLSDASVLFSRWQRLMGDREKEYPSADALIAAMNSCSQAEGLIPVIHNLSDRSNEYERRSEFESAAVESRAAYELIKHILDDRDSAAEDAKQAHRLLLTREGSLSIVSPTTHP